MLLAKTLNNGPSPSLFDQVAGIDPALHLSCKSSALASFRKPPQTITLCMLSYPLKVRQQPDFQCCSRGRSTTALHLSLSLSLSLRPIADFRSQISDSQPFKCRRRRTSAAIALASASTLACSNQTMHVINKLAIFAPGFEKARFLGIFRPY